MFSGTFHYIFTDDSGGDSDFEEWHENGGGDMERLSIHDPDDLDDGIKCFL